MRRIRRRLLDLDLIGPGWARSVCDVSTVMHDWSLTWDESLALNELQDPLNPIYIHSMCCTVKYRPSSTVVYVW